VSAADGAPGLFRVRLADGTTRLARGTTRGGPTELLAPDLTIATILRADRMGLADAVAAGPGGGPVPDAARVVAPVEDQEVWAAGVTYERSRDARMEESTEASVYDRVYDAARPELFFKAAGWRVRGPGESIGVRVDSDWDVPEPELALVLTPEMEIAGYVIGNDASSRTIEGENPLYLPQAKVYDGSCALGPALVPADAVAPPFDISVTIRRDDGIVFEGATSTARIRRDLEELAAYLGMALELPDGAILLTGTGVVPDPPFTLRPGDRVTIDGGPLGALENDVVAVGRAIASSVGQAAGSP
jgi:2-dehydro-3-deoxy-D-arabinonate dehydratase